MTEWTVTPELGMKRPFTPQRMLWVVRFNGVVYGKRYRSQGKAERFVTRMKEAAMAQFESEKFNVVKFENLTDHVETMAREAYEGGVRDAAVEAADAMVLAAAEIRRLQGMETRLLDLMAHKRDRINKDRAVAREQGDSWLGINTHTISANLLDGELQNLERVHNGTQ